MNVSQPSQNETLFGIVTVTQNPFQIDHIDSILTVPSHSPIDVNPLVACNMNENPSLVEYNSINGVVCYLLNILVCHFGHRS